MADWWCDRCERSFNTDDVIVLEESVPGEFWGSKCEHVTSIHHCPDCLDELDEYTEQDKTEEIYDDHDL